MYTIVIVPPTGDHRTICTHGSVAEALREATIKSGSRVVVIAGHAASPTEVWLFSIGYVDPAVKVS